MFSSGNQHQFHKACQLAVQCKWYITGRSYYVLQVAALCGVHCINTLLQGPFFSELDLAQVQDAQQCPALNNPGGYRTDPDWFRTLPLGSVKISHIGCWTPV
jgi:hypothetical protein